MQHIYDPWKYFIDEIEVNDLVFLYISGTGIIARGVATGIPEIIDYNGEIDEEHYMELDRFIELNNVVPASKITDLVGHNIKYNQTIISLSHECGLKVWQYITKHCL